MKTSFGAPPLITLISLADTDMLLTINAENAINPEIVFIGVHPSKLETLERAGMKHFFWHYQPRRKTLRMVVT